MRPSTPPTMADVARAAGVSTALVSIVMRGVPGAGESTRARVLATAEEIGYVPDQRARKLRQSRSRVIGVSFGLRHSFHGDLVEQLYVAAAARGLELSLSATAPDRDEDAAAGALLRERPEAVVLLGPTLDDEALGTLARRVPVVVVARASASPAVTTVRTDERAGVTAAVDHLLALGHRRIAHVDGGDAPGADERRTAFADTGRGAGLVAPLVVPGGLTEADGARAVRRLLDEADPPTAVLAFNDGCALGVLDGLRRVGREVPRAVSVVGFDDTHVARLAHVALTTVAQDAAGLAAAAITAAVDLAAGAPPGATVLAPHLVVRSTTGPVS